MDPELITLEQAFNKSQRHSNYDLELVVRHYTCHELAEKYGIRGQSCYTVFVVAKKDGTYGNKKPCCVYLAVSYLHALILFPF